MDFQQTTKQAMYKACYTHFMYGFSNVSPWNSEAPTEGYLVERSDLSETLLVQSTYNPDMAALDLPMIQVPRQAYCSDLAIAWTIQMQAIKRLKQHTLRPHMYVNTFDNAEGDTEIDISQHIEDREDAVKKCKTLGIRSMWDVSNNQEIFV